MASHVRQRDHSGLTCPECGSGMMGVLDSRVHAGSVRRRRKCMSCNFRITTYEVTAFEKRLIDEWVRRIEEVREIAQKLVTGVDYLEGRVTRAVQENVTMHDLTSGDRTRRPLEPGDLDR